MTYIKPLVFVREHYRCCASGVWTRVKAHYRARPIRKPRTRLRIAA
jgi:hypothetical protein